MDQLDRLLHLNVRHQLGEGKNRTKQLDDCPSMEE